MKKIFILTLIVIVSSKLFAQNAEQKDSCITIPNPKVVAYIPGQKDSLISKHHVRNGFVLKLSDPSFKILSYFIVFDIPDGTLVKIPSKREKLKPEKLFAAHLKKINKESILTVEQIKATKNGVCYMLKSLIYFIE